MHKVVSTSSGENRELIVKSLADQGESTVTGSTYLGKQAAAIPNIGGWIRKALDYKWIVIVMAGGLIIAGCIPRKRTTATPGMVQKQS